MAFMTETDKKQVSQAIREAERQTSGELVVLVAKAADPYRYIPLLWPALAALAVPVLCLLISPGMALADVTLIQLGLFLALQLLFLIPALKMRVIPRKVKDRRARRLAREQFFAQGIHRTEGRSGVLLFISIAEHYVEVIADAGIHEKVPAGTWDGVVAELTAKLRTGETAAGLAAAVLKIGEYLIEHFPSGEINKDEIIDGVIEIDGH